MSIGTVEKQVYSQDLKSCVARHGGSTPPGPTKYKGSCMTQKETLDKAYGSIPKEVTGDFDFFSAFPVPRSLKYYWYKLIRKVTR